MVLTHRALQAVVATTMPIISAAEALAASRKLYRFTKKRASSQIGLIRYRTHPRILLAWRESRCQATRFVPIFRRQM